MMEVGEGRRLEGKAWEFHGFDGTVKFPWLMLVLLLAIVGWRHILHTKKAVQDFLHDTLPERLGPTMGNLLAYLLQWYNLLFIFLAMLQLFNMGNIIRYSYITTGFLNPDIVKKSIKTNNVTADWDVGINPNELGFPEYLRWLSIFAPIVGTIAFILIMIHVKQHTGVFATIKSIEENGGKDGYRKYEIDEVQDMVCWIIFMPAVFIVMATRSVSRMWMVMRGYDVGYSAGLDIALFDENFDIACLSQYFIVLSFTQLCMKYIGHHFHDDKGTFYSEKGAELKHAMRWVGFQGAYAWILVGIVDTALHFGLSCLRVHAPSWMHKWNENSSKLDQLESSINLAFSLMTVLCVYNMGFICKMSLIKDYLGNATLKFNATRLLILLSQLQPKLILSLQKMSEDHTFLAGFEFSDNVNKLLHSSLLSIECIFIVALNYYAWEYDTTLETKKKGTSRMSSWGVITDASSGPKDYHLLDA